MYPSNNSFAQPYSRLLSVYDVARKPQSYGELIQKFGEGLKLLNFLHLAGQTRDVTAESITILEEGAPERPVTVSIAIEASADPIVCTFASADASDTYVREGFDLIIPADYTNKSYPTNWRLYKDGATWKALPYDGTARVNATVTTKEFILGASSWGYGTGQPTPMSKGYYSRTTLPRMIKEEGGVEGGMIFKENWTEIETEDGKKGLLSKLLTEMDFRLDSQIDAALFTAQKNDNAALTATSNISGKVEKIPSFDGMIYTMLSQGQELPYTTNFDMTAFESVKALLEAVGVTNKEVDFFIGTKLNSNIENSMLSWLGTYSNNNQLYSMVEKYTGFNTKVVQKNSITFYLNQLDSLSNPSKFGASELPYKDWGFMFPKGVRSVNLNGENLKLPHLTLGYAVGKTENRRRIFNAEPGVNGLGYDVVSNGYDGIKYHSMTHIVPIWNYMNQTIIVTKS